MICSDPMDKDIKIASRFALGMVVSLAAIVLLLFPRTPVSSLPVPEHGLVADMQTAASDGRTIQYVTLHSKTLGDIGCMISLPDPLPPGKLPLVIVLGGIKNGEDNIRHVKDIGNNVIIGYDWPISVRFYGQADFWGRIPSLYCQIMAMPAQVITAMDWLGDQPWGDGQRISLLGFSLGALAAPSIQDCALRDGKTIN